METTEHYSLLQKWLTGTSTEEENTVIHQWLAKDKENKRELEEIRSTWNESESGADGISDEQFNAGLVKLERNMTSSIIKERGLKRVRNASAFFLCANIIFTCAAIFFFTSQRDDFYDKHHDSIHADEKKITLPDGSFVKIKKGQLTSNFLDTTRNIRMAGEMFFDVKKEARPFIITLDQGIIKVTGTSFLVQTHAAGFDVFVKEGTVQVVHDHKKWHVDAGKHFKLLGNATPSISLNSELNFDSWFTKRLQFKNASLQDVVKELEKHYQIKCKLQPGLSTCKFTGTFNDIPLSEAIRVLCYSMDIEFNIDRDGTYEIVGPPCQT